jgi:CheY-like chemotaxis protein
VGTPLTQHWIVSVSRAAGLEGADALEIPSDTPMDAAWRRAARHTGVEMDELAERVAAHYRLPVADLGRAEAHARRLLPAPLARRLGVLPLRCTDRSVTVATADPVGLHAEREVSQVTGRSVQVEVAPPGRLATAIAAAYQGEPEQLHEPPAPDHRRETGARVLVVDDDADSRALLRKVLEDSGYRVEEAPDGPEAIDILDRSGPFDLVTLDLRMEKMQGMEVLRRMRSNLSTAAVPVVVATAVEDPALAMELIEAGADDFIVKPVDPPRFVLRVQAVLRRRSLAPFGL